MTLNQTILQPQTVDSEELAEAGWKIVPTIRPDGSDGYVYVPLTPEEFLHPEEDYRMPISAFHNRTNDALFDMLSGRYENDPTVEVFHDLLIDWDIPDLASHSPDSAVIFNVKSGKDINQTRFNVAVEGTRPSLIIEVVSPRYRKEDRVTKVEEYERARVLEYIILDQFRRGGQTVDEILGYELWQGRYRPMIPDEQQRLHSRTTGLFISLHDGKVILEDAVSGDRLLTFHELRERNSELAARALIAEQRASEEQQAREVAEQQARDLKAELEALRAQVKGSRRKKDG